MIGGWGENSLLTVVVSAAHVALACIVVSFKLHRQPKKMDEVEDSQTLFDAEMHAGKTVYFLCVYPAYSLIH